MKAKPETGGYGAVMVVWELSDLLDGDYLYIICIFPQLRNVEDSVNGLPISAWLEN